MGDAKEKEESAQDVPVALSEGNQVNSKDELRDSLPVTAEAVPNSCEGKIAPETHVQEVVPETHLQEVVPPEDNLDIPTIPQQLNKVSANLVPMDHDQELDKPDAEHASDVKTGPDELPPLDASTSNDQLETVQSSMDAKSEAFEVPETKIASLDDASTVSPDEPVTPHPVSSCIKAETENAVELKVNEDSVTTPHSEHSHLFILDENHVAEGSESGSEEEQSAFMKELDNFFRERSLEFKPPKFYGEGLNCLK